MSVKMIHTVGVYLVANAGPSARKLRKSLKAAACLALFQRVRAGQEEVTTCEAIITEVVYVFSSRTLYNLAAQDIRARLLPVLTLQNFQLPQKAVYLRALERYEMYPALDFEDVLSVAHMEETGVLELLSDDRDFDRIQGITRQEP